jgi:oxygen-independent coproporphyrinogen III oxidase
MLTPEVLAELSTRGPRYTSYPPATELRPIAAAAIDAELARIGAAGDPVALYVHVPFCRSLCAYCGCNVIPTRDLSRGATYIDVVATELALLANALGRKLPASELALGGGSPNFLEPRSIRELLATIGKHFELAPGARRSVELDPRDTTAIQLETFAHAGFRALSVGVQDFAAPVQDAIRRHQSRAQTRELIARARATGFTDVNVDLVYGLPRQTEESFSATLDSILELEPDRVALFGYAHLPSKLPHQRIVERAGRVLDSYERATLLLAIDRFLAAGYVHLGLDHFARPGSVLARAASSQRMTRTFQGYVEQRSDVILGVGTSAISSTPRMFWQNHVELPRWTAAIGASSLPVARGLVLDRDDQIRRGLIDRLMCDGAVDLRALGDRYDIDAAAYFEPELAQLASAAELASYDRAEARIDTTPLGRLLVRNVCMMFDRYHRATPDVARFSSTI